MTQGTEQVNVMY